MLHILLLILKIIGVVLAVILGIILLCVCTVLFVPVCYRAEGSGSGKLEDAELYGQISWLFGLVRVDADFKNKTSEYSVRIAWIKLGERSGSAGKREDGTHDEYYDTLSEIQEEEKNAKEQEPEISEAVEKSKKFEKSEDISGEVEKRHQAFQTMDEEQSGKASGAEEESKSQGRVSHIFSKIKQIREKIKCTIQKFCDRIKTLSGKKDQLALFVADEIHLRAFRKAKQELFRFLRRLSPRVMKANIHYGFEDPCLTGRVLAALSVIYPFVGEQTQITPDFQEKILEGEIQIRGRIFVVHLAALAVNLFLCRDVRRTIKDIKGFKL